MQHNKWIFDNYVYLTFYEGRVEPISLHFNVIVKFLVGSLSSYNQLLGECLQPRASH